VEVTMSCTSSWLLPTSELLFMRLCHVLLPAFLVDIDAALGTVINTNPGFFAADRTFHLSLPPLPFFPDAPELAPLPLSSLESVT
jgi:hypothetical protein